MELRQRSADDYNVWGSPTDLSGAFKQDFNFGSFCAQRMLPDLLYDKWFGSGRDASPWQHGAPPFWLLRSYLAHLADITVRCSFCKY